MIRKHIDLLVAIIWSIISITRGLNFVTTQGKLVESYEIGRAQRLFWCSLAIFFAIIAIYAFCKFFVNAIKNDGSERKILIYALPFLFVFMSYFFITYVRAYNASYYQGDEKLVWDAAVNMYPYFFVYLSEIYLWSFFILPTSIAPTIVKIFMEAMIMGYIVWRVKKYYKTKNAYFIYLLCMLSPFYTLGVEIHRMQWYSFIYLFVMVKLFFDIREKNNLPFKWVNVITMIFLISLLSVLRREGLYLILLGLILLLMAYGSISERRVTIIMIAIFLVAEIIVYLPVLKNGMDEKGTTTTAIIVHMLGEKSLNRDVVSKELEVLDKVFDIEIIDRYNTDMGIEAYDKNYYDEIGWNSNYYFIHREVVEATPEEIEDAYHNLILKQPIVFLKSRIRAFLAAGREESAYNLYLPSFILLAELLYSIIKKNKEMLLIFGCVLIHISITTLAMPASFFKYFFEMYLMSYTFIIIVILDNIKSRNLGTMLVADRRE